ncbi:MAG: selenoneine synthase SenA [Pseudomonadota bacterium]
MEIQAKNLIYQLTDAHQRVCTLIDHLSDEQLMGPRLPTTNPLRWEIGHTAYFYEYWILRHHYGEAPLISNIDELFDSIHIPHDARWDLNLPSMKDTIAYIKSVKQRVIEHLSSGEDDPKRDYLTQYAIFHEDMHCEAFTYTRQTLSYPAPNITHHVDNLYDEVSIEEDIYMPSGSFDLGADNQNNCFVFDNEKWSHSEQIKPFKISRYAVCNKQFLSFIEAGGYQSSEYWSEEGWQWKLNQNLDFPVYWRNNNSRWEVRWFDQWYALKNYAAVVNISWYEAQAYCTWANRRLPTELEWEVAAAGKFDECSKTYIKRDFPWGEQIPDNTLVNMDGITLGTIDVRALPQGESAQGCRQMLGNVWEWTDSTFRPYPGFVPDMYEDYSQPLFGKTKVLRGGCWATRSRLIRNTWRNYYGPGRNDVFAGLRTCAQ